MVDKINKRFGKKVVEQDLTTKTDFVFKGEGLPGKSNEGLTLQVGDTNEDFQNHSFSKRYVCKRTWNI